MSGINLKLARSIQMIEVATNKMHEKRTGRKVDVKASVTANGIVKVIVAAKNIEAEDAETSLMAAQYMLNDMYISDVLIQYNLPHRKVKVDTFSLEWIEAHQKNECYTVLGELVATISVKLFSEYDDLTSYQGNVVTFHTTSDAYITLDCVDCEVIWHQAKVA